MHPDHLYSVGRHAWVGTRVRYAGHACAQTSKVLDSSSSSFVENSTYFVAFQPVVQDRKIWPIIGTSWSNVAVSMRYCPSRPTMFSDTPDVFWKSWWSSLLNILNICNRMMRRRQRCRSNWDLSSRKCFRRRQGWTTTLRKHGSKTSKLALMRVEIWKLKN